ncbi:MAG: ribonucleoside-triphosphate reductase, adenosylcobalamin-dependent [Cyanobacteria bacterium P01_F01_bin.150]
MVQDIERTRPSGSSRSLPDHLNGRDMASQFPATAPAANPVFYRTYSRRSNNESAPRESWLQVCDRTLKGLVKLGQLTAEESDLIRRMQRQIKALPSGRWLWVGGTEWIERPENFNGAYNCTSTNVVDWRAFGLMMNLAMMGCGTGAVLETHYIEQLPAIRNRLNVGLTGEIGSMPAGQRRDETEVVIEGNQVTLYVGDSRIGWVKSYQTLLELSTDERFDGEVTVNVNLSDVRPAGEKLKGFGGVANPIRLPELYGRCANILNKAVGRKLNSIECCLLIDEAAVVVVAGNVRRSAGMRQFSSNDELAATAKENLWMQDEEGNWRIDPERDALRMANHTRVFHHKPTLDECLSAVRKQYYSGEGAIQWAGEAKRRASGSARYGLNPCVTADTWVHTGDGPRQVKELIGQQHSTYVNGELFSTTVDGFFYSGTKPVLKLSTKEGYALRLTGNHKVLKVTAQTQKKQYTEWVATEELEKGDCILIHNHRDLQPWDGSGSYEEGWLLGSLVGDGSLYTTQGNDSACLRFWEETQDEMAAYAVTSLEKAVGYKSRTEEAGHYHKQLKHRVINSVSLARLAAEYDIVEGAKAVTPAVEQASYPFYRGFLRGLFDADGSIQDDNVQGTQQKGVSVRLAQSNLDTLEAVQRMLARIGIAATIYKNRRPAGTRMLPNSQRQPAEYVYKAQHELIIVNDNLDQFQALVGFQEPHKAEKLHTLLAGYKRKLSRERFTVTITDLKADGVEPVYDCTVPGVSQFDANGLVAHNCGEIIGENFHCNLAEVHLNQLDPNDYQDQDDAFRAGAIAVAALLNHQFVEPRYQKSREEDPIVGVSFTGLFDFFVHAFGAAWLNWWAEGRPDTITGMRFKQREKEYLIRWRDVVHQTVWDYCDRHSLTRPNRCTTVQPAGTKSLLTGASSGWHPPKAQRFIRRITFGKNDPVALACLDYGYSIVPAQSDKDEEGRLLNDPFDPRCTEWLVEIPTEVSWANLPGADAVDISQFSALAQFDFYMQVQKYYTAHNTSATIELREPEVDALGTRIFEAIRDDEGYMSAALLARFDDHETFPRLPFEPISKATYEQLSRDVLSRRTVDDFAVAMANHDVGDRQEEGPAGCDSDKCMLPEKKP